MQPSISYFSRLGEVNEAVSQAGMAFCWVLLIFVSAAVLLTLRDRNDP